MISPDSAVTAKVADRGQAEFQSFPGWIAGHAANDAQGIAFIEGEHGLTWNALAGRMRQVAAALVVDRVRPGDTVAILGHPSLAYVECLFGCIAARACAVPVAITASVDTVAAILHDCAANIMCVDGQRLGAVELRDELPRSSPDW